MKNYLLDEFILTLLKYGPSENLQSNLHYVLQDVLQTRKPPGLKRPAKEKVLGYQKQRNANDSNIKR